MPVCVRRNSDSRLILRFRQRWSNWFIHPKKHLKRRSEVLSQAESDRDRRKKSFKVFYYGGGRLSQAQASMSHFHACKSASCVHSLHWCSCCTYPITMNDETLLLQTHDTAYCYNPVLDHISDNICTQERLISRSSIIQYIFFGTSSSFQLQKYQRKSCMYAHLAYRAEFTTIRLA